MPLRLDQARAYANKALAHADGIRAPVSVAVVDEFGLLVQMDRQPGAKLMSPDLAEAKALTALNFQRPTSSLPGTTSVLNSIGRIVHFKLMPVAGGIPITEADGTVVGAIGISGATDEKDGQIAQFALT